MNSYVNMGVGALLGTVFVLMSVSHRIGRHFPLGGSREGRLCDRRRGRRSRSRRRGRRSRGRRMPIATLLASADAAAGEAALQEVRRCHSGEKGGPNKVGPDLWDIVEPSDRHA